MNKLLFFKKKLFDCEVLYTYKVLLFKMILKNYKWVESYIVKLDIVILIY
jgi:hypothetical protein